MKNIIDITNDILTINTVDINIINFKNINFMPKFNPSIIHLYDNKYLISYRIWIDKYIENINEYPNPNSIGSPWFSNWEPFIKKEFSNYDIIKKESKTSSIEENIEEKLNLNFFGLVIIEIFENKNYNIIHDQIIKLNFSFIEDGRLFIDSNNIIRILLNASLNITNSFIIYSGIPENKISRGIICCKIGNIDKIKNDILNYGKIFVNKPYIICPEVYQYKIEKNFIPFISNDNSDYISSFSLPFGTPIKKCKINSYDNNQLELTNYHYSIVHSENEIIEENVKLFDEINLIYGGILRFSSGTNFITFENENLAVGHLVIDIKKFKKNMNNKLYFNQEFLKKNYHYSNIHVLNINYNIKKLFLKSENYNYNEKIYMMYFYTTSKNYPYNITKISHAFMPNNLKSNICFPTGISWFNENIIISYGDSDNSCCLYFINKKEIYNKLMDININPCELLLDY